MPRIVFLAVLLAAAPSAWAQPRWVGSWAASQQAPEPQNALGPHDLDDATLRQSVHLSIGGSALRVRLSNTFGAEPLHVAAAHIAAPAAPGSDTIRPGTDHALSFSGRPDVTIPAGADYVSDPVVLDVPSGADIAITLYFDASPVGETGHPGSRTTSWRLHGDHIADPALPGATRFDHWFVIAGIDVRSDAHMPEAGAVVALGDSITDGRGSTTNGNDRWTDALARRFAQARMPVAVLNHGIGGGRVLLDGLGPSAMARFDRDVLAQPGVRWLIVFEAINDIGTFDRDGTRPKTDHDALVAELTTAYAQMIEKAHAAGIKVYGATITPFMDCAPYHPGSAAEADRIAVNGWIRTHFDAVLDFDAAVRDPARPGHLAAAYDSGDGLHLSPDGYRALAAAVPLALFHP